MESEVSGERYRMGCPLTELVGTPARDHFQTLLNRPESWREVERRWNRGRDGGPGSRRSEATGD